MAATRRIAVVMFTDLVGYTALAHSHESEALGLVQEQEELVRPLLAQYQGREVKSTGDGLLVEFESALGAVECAVEIQQRLRARNARRPERPLQVRIGVHVGDVERHGTDILGDAVNIAARIEPIAEPGGICLTQAVAELVKHRAAFELERLEPRPLKGIPEPVTVYRVRTDGALPSARGDGPSFPRIAVLPLANISPDPNDAYFADGLTEELISVLSRIHGLRVISRTSVSSYRTGSKPVAQIGAELGVASVLEGSVRKAGDRLRITVQLIDVRTDEHRWAQTYDRQLDNVFAIQAEVAEQTAHALELELLKPDREVIRVRPTSSLPAYESYLRGIDASRRYPDPGAMVEAERWFEAAIREDPEFAAAYAQLANLLVLVAGGTRPTREAFPKAREYASRAITLAPQLAEAHLAAGNLAMQEKLDWSGAEEEFRAALQLNPSSSLARFWYGHLLLTLQRFDEAKSQLQAAIEIDPLWLLPRLALGNLFLSIGDPATGIAWATELQRQYPQSRGPIGLLAAAYVQAGRVEEAVRALEPLRGVPDLDGRGLRAHFLSLAGHPEELRALETAWRQGEITDYTSAMNIATAYASLGEKERALSVLEKDYREGDRTFWAAYQAFPFDTLRDDPRFVALLRAMNLPLTLSRKRVVPSTGPPPASTESGP